TPKGMRVVWRGKGENAYLAGIWKRELIVYFDERILGIDYETGKARSIARLSNAAPRRFALDGDSLLYTVGGSIGRIDLASGELHAVVSTHNRSVTMQP